MLPVSHETFELIWRLAMATIVGAFIGCAAATIRNHFEEV